MHFAVVFYNNRDQSDFGDLPNLSQTLPLLSHPFPSRTSVSHSFRGRFAVARRLRYTGIMEATQGHPNLLSEKQAAKRLGVARITLLRAREAGRIRFFRIGTRVLYCAEQLTEFLAGCERNRHKQSREAESQAARKENRVSSGRGSVSGSDGTRPPSKSDSRKKDQAILPFTTSR